MNSIALIGLGCLLGSNLSSSMILTKGASMELAEEAMKNAKHAGKIKFRPTELAMITLKKNSDFRCWRVDQGVLIVQYATDTKKIENMEYKLMDTYSHAAEVQFSFEVCSFNTESGRMEIMTQSPAEAFVPSDEEIQSRLKRVRSRIREMEKEHEDSEHAVVPNRSLPSSQKSTSPVSGSED